MIFSKEYNEPVERVKKFDNLEEYTLHIEE